MRGPEFFNHHYMTEKKSVEWNDARHTYYRYVFIWLTNVPVTTVLGQFYDCICLNAWGKFLLFLWTSEVDDNIISRVQVGVFRHPCPPFSTPHLCGQWLQWHPRATAMQPALVVIQQECPKPQHLCVPLLRSPASLHPQLGESAALRLQAGCCLNKVLYWPVQEGFLTPLTFARHHLSPLAAFTSGAYFLHNERQWWWICEFYTANFKGIFGGL